MTWMLLAEKAVASQGFRRWGDDWSWSSMIPVAGVVVTFAFILWLVRKLANRPEPKAFHHPGRLFAELCQAHHLDRAAQGLLKQLASAHGIKPAMLFLLPERFDVAALGPRWQAQQSKVAAVRDVLFAP